MPAAPGSGLEAQRPYPGCSSREERLQNSVGLSEHQGVILPCFPSGGEPKGAALRFAPTPSTLQNPSCRLPQRLADCGFSWVPERDPAAGLCSGSACRGGGVLTSALGAQAGPLLLDCFVWGSFWSAPSSPSPRFLQHWLVLGESGFLEVEGRLATVLDSQSRLSEWRIQLPLLRAPGPSPHLLHSQV